MLSPSMEMKKAMSSVRRRMTSHDVDESNGQLHVKRKGETEFQLIFQAVKISQGK